MNHFRGISSSRDIFLESGGNKKIKWGSLFLIWSGFLGYYRRKSVPKDQLSLAFRGMSYLWYTKWMFFFWRTLLLVIRACQYCCMPDKHASPGTNLQPSSIIVTRWIHKSTEIPIPRSVTIYNPIIIDRIRVSQPEHFF